MNGTVLIAGAGLAGARTAETLRTLGWEGRIILAGDEPHAPYERPALSKELLAGTKTDLALRPAGFWEERDIELLRRHRVDHIDVQRHVALVGGREVAWDSLVIATGARARSLDGPRGVHTLRSLGDARRLAADVSGSTRLVVVGAGFIGGEVASTLLPRVASVTVVDPLQFPLERVLGPEVGALLAGHYRSFGVDLRLGVGVAGFDGDPRVRAVRLTDGTSVEADAVVVGIGAIPQLPGGPGAVEVDACGRTQIPWVYAAGDVASWWRESLGRSLRVEHWTSAAGQARAVAATIAGTPTPYDETPYFWSDQFGLRLQHVGHAESWHRVEVTGAEGSFTARYLDAGGGLVAALAVNRAAEIAGLRRELAA